MKEIRMNTDAGKQYASAYEAHYATKDIQKAFALYGHIVATLPDTREAGYSRSQIQNIVNAVVPKKVVMDSLMELARIHFEQNAKPEAKQASL